MKTGQVRTTRLYKEDVELLKMIPGECSAKKIKMLLDFYIDNSESKPMRMSKVMDSVHELVLEGEPMTDLNDVSAWVDVLLEVLILRCNKDITDLQLKDTLQRIKDELSSRESRPYEV